MIVWGAVLGFFGLNIALLAWLAVRITVGPIWALIVFYAVLAGTYFGIISLLT